jgi:hypothetical protein
MHKFAALFQPLVPAKARTQLVRKQCSEITWIAAFAAMSG